MSLLSPPSQVERDYNATQRDYRRALRMLKDDPVNRLALRDRAREEGIDVSQIVRRDERSGFVQGRQQRFEDEAQDAATKRAMDAREAELNLQRAEQPAGVGGGAPPADAEIRETESGRFTVTRDNPTVGIRGPGGQMETVSPPPRADVTAGALGGMTGAAGAGMGMAGSAAPLSRAAEEAAPASRIASPGGLGGVATRSGLTRKGGTRWWNP